MNLEFRPATAEDADLAVPLIYSSGPLAFDFAFGSDRLDAVSFLRKAFIHGSGTFGHRNHVVGALDGIVVAAGTAYSGDTTVSESVAVARQIVSAYRLGAPSIITRGLRVESVISPPSKGVHYVAHLGVTEDVRGRGVGRALVEYLHEQGRSLGREVAELDVSIANPEAQALYERLGYEVVKEQSSTLANRFGRVVDHRRMRFDLTA